MTIAFKDDPVAFSNNPTETDKLVMVGNIKNLGHEQFGTKFVIVEHEGKASGKPYRKIYQEVGFVGQKATEHYDYTADIVLIDTTSDWFKENKRVMFGRAKEKDGRKFLHWSIKMPLSNTVGESYDPEPVSGTRQAEVYATKDSVNGIDYSKSKSDNKSDDFEDDIPF